MARRRPLTSQGVLFADGDDAPVERPAPASSVAPTAPQSLTNDSGAPIVKTIDQAPEITVRGLCRLSAPGKVVDERLRGELPLWVHVAWHADYHFVQCIRCKQKHIYTVDVAVDTLTELVKQFAGEHASCQW